MQEKARPPHRLPVARMVRHRGILRALLAAPPAGLTIRALALRSGVPYATTWRVVEDLRRLGAIAVDPGGASRQVRVNAGSPLLEDLGRIAAGEVAPHPPPARRGARLPSRAPAVRPAI